MLKYAIFVFTFFASTVHADCGGLGFYKVNTKVQSCSLPKLDLILVELNKYNIESEYKGVELKTSHGLIFVPSKTGLSCKNIDLNIPLDISIELACCDGDPNVPCLLGYEKKAQLIEHKPNKPFKQDK